ncbi:MAG: ATP-binding cassette domain-containing protein [Alphaproteobacteria bacterium]|nr:ATP-binding cassette domain-containing protein [Alphaproteobacteria bacterium]MBQ6849545.1 ATP-binding cassette domain-containing protein [Oscillospiraceae bacterium]
MNKLEIFNLSKIIKKTPFSKSTQKKILNNINITFTPGINVILGPNGAGKSTLLNMIIDSTTDTKNNIIYNGAPTYLSNHDFRKELGYLPQNQQLYDFFTVEQFAYYIASLKGINASNVPDEVQYALRCMNLNKYSKQKISKLSGGMKQRLLIATTILGRPSVIVLDEPFVGLDPIERYHFLEILKKLSKNSIIIITTHIISDIEKIADRVIFLKNGMIIENDSPVNLINKYSPSSDLFSAYLKCFNC